MALKFKIGKVKAKGMKEFMYKELNNPRFVKKIGLNRVEMTEKNVKHLPQFELFLLNTPQLKKEYFRLQEIIRSKKLDMLQIESVMRRYMAINSHLKARGVKGLRPLREAVPDVIKKNEGEILYTDLAFGIKPKTRRRWEAKEKKFWNKLRDKISLDITITKK